MRCALDVPRQNVTNGAALAQRGVKRVDRGARHAEGDRNAFPLQHEHCSVHCVHSSHLDPPMSLTLSKTPWQIPATSWGHFRMSEKSYYNYYITIGYALSMARNGSLVTIFPYRG